MKNYEVGNKMGQTRRAGILLPVSALPSNEGIGTLGEGAYAFIDWLYAAGIQVWQVLPLLPTGYGDSPYQSCASNALNYYFIDLKTLEKEGLLLSSDYDAVEWSKEERRVDYGRLFQDKVPVLEKAFSRFSRDNADWHAFVEKGEYRDFAIFMTLKRKFNYAPWSAWDEPYASARLPENFETEHEEELLFWQFTQYIFLKQWQALKEYANERGVQIMGDMPIYLAEDSVETWKYRKELFMLDEEGELSERAGVPPDAFSEDGQFWGNPVYDWEKLRATDYAWWKERLHSAFAFFNILRIDHFRAFDRFFAIPADAESAKEGRWLDGPKAALFKGFEDAPIVAEDLGVVDDGVRRLLKDTGYPGMKVFAFAFDGDEENEYLPSNITERNCVVYTGTHDNAPLRAFLDEMPKKERKAFEKTLEEECLQADVPYLVETAEEECKTIVELLFASVADLVVVPLHDVLCMGEEARINAPSTVSQNNWTFRFTEKDFGRRKAAWLKTLTEKYER